MKYRQALVFSYQRFENALISIIFSGPLTRFTPISNFPIFFSKNRISLGLLNVVLKIVYQKGLVRGKSIFFSFIQSRFLNNYLQRLSKSFASRIISNHYMWDTRRLLKRIDGHKQKSSSVYKHFLNKHNIATPTCLLEPFDVFAKCHTKFDCLITQMLFIRIFEITIPQRAK